MANAITATTAVIVNLTEQAWTLHRGYGTFTVHGVAERDAAKGDLRTGDSAKGDRATNDGTSYAYMLTRVSGRNAIMDLGDKRSLDVPISATEVAQDLCREINSDGGENSFFGVFVAAGDEPTDAELTAARARLEMFYRRMVAAADREWERSHSYLFINDVERRAAQYLGLEKEWFYQVRETSECPACGEKVKPGVAVCKTCGAILDREKVMPLGLGTGYSGGARSGGARQMLCSTLRRRRKRRNR